MYQASLDQCSDILLTKCVDIQCSFGCKVREGARENERATGTTHSVHCLASRPLELQLGILALKLSWVINQLGISWAQLWQHSLDLRDDVPRLEDHHCVATPHIEPGNLVGIVQAGVLHRRASHDDWVEHRHWCGSTRPANANDDIAHNGSRLLGCVFVGHCTTRVLTHHTEAVVESAIIDLDHKAIGIER